MSFNTAVQPAMESTHLSQTGNIEGRRYSSQNAGRPLTRERFSQFVKSLDGLISIYQSLPQNKSVIENMAIKGNEVVVKYKSASSELVNSSLDNKAVSVNGMDVFRLDNGKMIERWSSVYQIKT